MVFSKQQKSGAQILDCTQTPSFPILQHSWKYVESDLAAYKSTKLNKFAASQKLKT